MRFKIHKTGGGHLADVELLKFLNSLPPAHKAVHIQAGQYGKYHGLDEENEVGYKIIVDTHDGRLRDDEGRIIA